MTSTAKRLAACLALLLNTAATAQMRCDTELISEGDSEIRVLAACGEPMQRELIFDQPLIDERWVYNFGPTEFVRIVNFNNGLVDSVEIGDDYGYAVDFN